MPIYNIYIIYIYICKYHQYVGKSEPTAHKRFNTHRYDVTSPKGLAFDKHFNEPGHDYNHHARFILIEQVKQHQNLSPAENRRILEDREDFWMMKLKTLAPLGHNDRLNSTKRARLHAICM